MNEPAYSTVLEPARRILALCHEKDFDTDPLNLMKLVYISHGWSLALKDTPLFPEEVQAWRYGPVIPRLYQATKMFGRDPILEEGLGKVTSDGNKFDALLRSVVSQYGHLGGLALSNLTHRSGSPWFQVYKQYERDVKIPNVKIKQHYVALKNG